MTLDPSSAEPTPARTLRLWILCAVAGSVLYIGTCQRGVSWQDSGMHQWRVVTGDYVGHRGLALSHPLYIAMGQAVRPIPISDLPTRLNALSGIGMAVALANLACLCTLLTRRWWIGAAAAAMLGVAHTPWWLGTIAETYTWQVAGMTAEVWLLVRLIRRPHPLTVVSLAMLNGLGLCLHNMALLSLAVYVVVAVALTVRRRMPLWVLPAGAGAWLIGAAPYIMMTGLIAQRIGLWAAVVSALTGGYGDEVLNVSSTGATLRANAILGGMDFVSALGPLAIVGWMRFRRRLGGPVSAALAGLTVVHALFVMRYPVPDQFTFLLPSLVMVAIAAAIGLAAMADHSPAWRKVAVAVVLASVSVGPTFYAAAPSLARWAGASNTPRAPRRNELRYWLVPWKHTEHSAHEFAQAAMDEAAPCAVILPDNTSRYALLLTQHVENRRPDIVVQKSSGPLPAYGDDPAIFRRVLGERTLYTVRNRRGRVSPALTRDAELVRAKPDSVLFEVRWKR